MAQIIRQTAALPLICASSPGQANQPESPIPAHPVLSGSEWERGFPGDVCQRHVLLQVWTECLVAVEGALALLLGQLSQLWAGCGVARRGCHAPRLRKIMFKNQRKIILKMTGAPCLFG